MIVCISYIIEGVLIKKNKGPIYFFYWAVSGGKRFAKYKIRLIKQEFIDQNLAKENNWLAYSSEWSKESRTFTGSFVKKYYLDEIPQFISILKGEMSIVGPRPLSEMHYERDIAQGNITRKLLKGGIGGLGNVHFKSSTKQAPHYSQPGMKGVEEWINLELKVLADVGLVGFPNAGKSTLLSSISKAKPKIGNYPFTTLTPNLGVVAYRDNLSFIMADIPGIIEGASKGKGLGIRFLRHIERNSILLFMIPIESEIQKEFKLLLKELKNYNKELLEKKIIIAITKSDLVSREELNNLKTNFNEEVIKISSITGYGLDELKDAIWNKINSNK